MSQTWTPSNKANIPRQQVWSSDGTSIRLPKAGLAYCSRCFLLPPSLAVLLQRALLLLHLKLWHWIYSDLQVGMSHPPDARSHQLRAFSVMGVSSSQPDEQGFCLSLLGVQVIVSTEPLRRSDQPLHGRPWCCAVCWPPPMVLLPGNIALLPGHSSCRQEDHLPLPQQDWSLWTVSYILLGVKRVYNTSTSRQVCPAEYNSLTVTGSPCCSNFSSCVHSQEQNGFQTHLT